MTEIIEEFIEEIIEQPYLSICVDGNGYYTTENTGILAEIKEMPSITDVKQLLAYKYNEETKELEADEEKLAEINYEIENPPVTLTTEERLIDLENAFLELSMMMLGGM